MIDILKKYFPDLSAKQAEQFEALDSVYRAWNERINVISRKDIDQLYERHVLHSLAIAKIAQFAEGSRVIDVGTGGGFPGIPLAIYFPDVHFHLVDSIGKKIKVVQAVIDALQLKNVTAEQKRMAPPPPEGGKHVLQIPPSGGGGAYDFAVSRAVAPLNEMVPYLKPLVRKGLNSSLPNGMIFLKGGDLNKEISAIKLTAKTFEVSDFFTEEFFAEKKIVYISV